MQLVKFFDEVDMRSVGLVGGKNASLGEMICRTKVPVPFGFAITSDAYKYFIKYNKLDKEIRKILTNTNVKNIGQLKKSGKQIRSLIEAGKFPTDLEELILKSFDKLKSAKVAVRSSATAEDLPDASFAGQQESYLNIGKSELLKHVKKCFASLFTDRAISYREDKKFDHFKVYLSVGVQCLIKSDVSGVMFTLEPDSGHKGFVFINGSWGLGDYIVQGKTNPDKYIVHKDTMGLISKELGSKTKMEIRTDKGVKGVSVPVGKQKSFVLSNIEIKKLVKYGLAIEKHYKKPMDIEWAKSSGKLWIVQSRPVTVNVKKNEYVEYKVDDGKVLATGSSIGRSVAQGNISVIKSIREMKRFKKGQILVTKETDPDWEPIMKLASGIVTEVGGSTCFSGDTKVLTDKGFLCISELDRRIFEGEHFNILGYDYKNNKSIWKEIKSVHKNKKECIRIAVSQTGRVYNNTIDITPDHKMYTFDNRALIKKSLNQILNNQDGVCLVDNVPETNISVDNHKLSYLLGALVTDGCIRLVKGKEKLRRGIIVFTQKKTDEKADFIETVNSYFLEIFGKKFTPRDKFTTGTIRGQLIQGSATDYTCCSLETALELSKIVQNLPSLVLNMSEESSFNFLAGLIDGDGSFYNNRINLYIGKNNVLESAVLACLKLSIVPAITTNRNIYNLQITERIEDILKYTKRVKGSANEKILGTKLFSARQVIGDIINNCNYKGRLRQYVNNNLLIDSRKLEKFALPMLDKDHKKELSFVLKSSTRMYRVSYIENLGINEVFNIEVDAESEMDHNFVVFTKRYTPLLVSNCHAAIISRELGIPAIVGCENATHILKNSSKITLDCTSEVGKVLSGFVKFSKKSHDVSKMPKTKTEILVNIGNPDMAFDISQLPVDGVGLARQEFIISSYIGEHPLKMLAENRGKEYSDKLAEGIAKICSAFYPRKVVVRLSDFKTDEYRSLIGGNKYEPQEANPMIGWRGSSRYISKDYEKAFELECIALKKVFYNMRLNNLVIMVPFCRTIEEAVGVIKLLKKHSVGSIPRYVMAEIPSNIILEHEFAQYFSGFSIGSNDLTQLTLGIDRNNEKLSKEFDERNEAVKFLIKSLIKNAHKDRKTVSICGEAPSNYPEFVHFLVKNKIDAISVEHDSVIKTRVLVSKIEHR